MPDVEVVSDSELIVKQMRGEYRVKNEALRALFLEATALARGLAERRVSAREARAQRARRQARQRGARRGVNHPFADAVLADDHDAALATLADDVVFRSPAVYKPYQGKEQVGGILRLVATVFENFRYTAEWRDGATTILFFEANVGDRELQGIDILEENDDGLVERFTVMIRPLSGLQAVAAAMAARLSPPDARRSTLVARRTPRRGCGRAASPCTSRRLPCGRDPRRPRRWSLEKQTPKLAVTEIVRAADGERCAERAREPPGELGGVACVADAVGEHDELVAAEACDEVAGPQRVAQRDPRSRSAARRRRDGRACR